MTVARMWEARVAPGALAQAEMFCRDVVVPEALRASDCLGAEWFTDGVSRVVVVTRWPDGPAASAFAEGEPSGPVLDRAHAWVFTVGG